MSTHASHTSTCRLSVLVVCHDESAALKATLANVAGLAGEVVIVETGSGLRAAPPSNITHIRLSFPWQNDMSAARRMAVAAARGQWVLWLEPGEVLSSESRAAIEALVNPNQSAHEAQLLLIETPPFGARAWTEEAAELRLLPRQFAALMDDWTGNIDRRALAASGVPIVLGTARIERTLPMLETAFRRPRSQRRLRTLHAAIAARGALPELLVALGELELEVGQPAVASQHFRHALATAERGSLEMLAAYCGWFSTFDESDATGRRQQLALGQDALEVFPFDAQLLCAVGSCLQSLGQEEIASRTFELAFRFGQVHPEVSHLRDLGEFSALLWVMSRQALGDTANSLAAAREAYLAHPTSIRLRNLLLDALVREAQTTEALELLNGWPVEVPQIEPLRSAIRGACQAARKNWISALAYLETAYRAGCRQPLCLRWYAAALIAAGNAQLARGVVSEWIELSPQDREPREILAILDQALEAAIAPPPQTTASSPAAEATTPASDSAFQEVESDIRRLRIDSARQPADAQIHFHLGQAYQAQGDDLAALAVWQDFLRRSPKSQRIVQATCEVLLKLDRVPEAIALAASLEPQADVGPFRQFMAGVELAQNHSWEAAAVQFERARKGGYDPRLLLPRLSICQVKLGRLADAQTTLNEISRLQPPHFPLTSVRDGRVAAGKASRMAPPQRG